MSEARDFFTQDDVHHLQTRHAGTRKSFEYFKTLNPGLEILVDDEIRRFLSASPSELKKALATFPSACEGIEKKYVRNMMDWWLKQGSVEEHGEQWYSLLVAVDRISKGILGFLIYGRPFCHDDYHANRHIGMLYLICQFPSRVKKAGFKAVGSQLLYTYLVGCKTLGSLTTSWIELPVAKGDSTSVWDQKINLFLPCFYTAWGYKENSEISSCFALEDRAEELIGMEIDLNKVSYSQLGSKATGTQKPLLPLPAVCRVATRANPGGGSAKATKPKPKPSPKPSRKPSLKPRAKPKKKSIKRATLRKSSSSKPKAKPKKTKTKAKPKKSTKNKARNLAEGK